MLPTASGAGDNERLADFRRADVDQAEIGGRSHEVELAEHVLARGLLS